MIDFILKKIFGTKNARELKRIQPLVQRVNELGPDLEKLSDAELRAKTGQFRQRIERGETLDALLPEAFAVCREGGKRALGMRHFDVQLVGGIVLHEGRIAEMKTGEGKTLVATLPAYLNALEGRGVHVVTVNDYLARRDSDWMGRLHRFLGLDVGVVVHGLSDTERQKAYRADITYGQNNEFGFDYLRDNMKESIERYVQRELNFAIVDEVDSILVDEARTPLIISGPAEESADLYIRANQIIPGLKKDVDYTVDEKAHSAMLTDAGVERVERRLGLSNLYDPENIDWLHHVQKALQAHTLYKRDVNYLVEAGEVIIVDEFTGRKMPGRRWSDGLHQAVEAKENVRIREENQTLATITFQNYFRMFRKLSGMTGTADTEAEEFHKIYKLDVVVIPPNLSMVRQDFHDVIYKNERGKFNMVLDEIEDCHKRGQPVLVGTVSVEKSEVLSALLRKRNIPHNVLNAKQHEREAEIIAQAGRQGAVTISTNMAGRGTDILLGGNAEAMARVAVGPSFDPVLHADAVERLRLQCKAEHDRVIEAGGLHIIGTERHESRRIDNQLRGRAGRQGDPGSSRFYLSLEDDLMRIFGADRIQGLMERMGMRDDEPIEHSIVNRAIESAQHRVEGHNFDIRKNLLEYDDVMNQQRKSIYALRRQILEGRYRPQGGGDGGSVSAQRHEPSEGDGGPATAITVSGPWSIDRLVDALRPVVTKLVEPLLQPPPPPAEPSGTPDTEPQGVTAAPATPERLQHELYRWFGAVVDVQRAMADRGDKVAALVSVACREIASALLQQRERLLDLCDEIISLLLGEHCPERVSPEEWDLDALAAAARELFNVELKVSGGDRAALAQELWEQIEKVFSAREQEFGVATAGIPVQFYYWARHLYLDQIDTAWIEHLKHMDHLREGIGLRGYGQRDPKQEYKKEGYDMFLDMLANIQRNVASKLFRLRLVAEEAIPQEPPAARAKPERKMILQHGEPAGADPRAAVATGSVASPPAGADDGEPTAGAPIRRQAPKVGRNDPCPCGSGKKYKKCHGASVTASG
jgi:preprotein translocase subunit SecA